MIDAEDYKKIVLQQQLFVKEQQKKTKDKIQEGWLDDIDLTLIENPDYFNQTMQKLNNNVEKHDQPEQKKLTFWEKLKNLFTI